MADLRSVLPHAVPFLLLAALSAQTPVLCPSMAATADGSFDNLSLLYGGGNGRAHTQALFATSDLAVTNGTITGLSLRGVGPVGGGTPLSIHLRIEMSMSSVTIAAAQATFAQNVGPAPVVVFDGTYVVPAIAPSVAFPPAMLPEIVFTTPFVYDGSLGASLVVDVTTSQSSSTQIYRTGAVSIGGGFASNVYVTGSCLHSKGSPSGAYGYQQFQPYPGGDFSLSLLGYPSHVTSFNSSVMMIGFTGGVGASVGGFALPVPLTTLGLQASSPFCMLAVFPDIVLPMTYLQGASGGSSGAIAFGPLSIPLGLAGFEFFTQALSVDYDNTMPQPLLFPSLALKWTVGTGNRPAGTTVTRLSDTVPAQTTGGVQFDQVPVMQFTFQ